MKTDNHNLNLKTNSNNGRCSWLLYTGYLSLSAFIDGC